MCRPSLHARHQYNGAHINSVGILRQLDIPIHTHIHIYIYKYDDDSVYVCISVIVCVHMCMCAYVNTRAAMRAIDLWRRAGELRPCCMYTRTRDVTQQPKIKRNDCSGRTQIERGTDVTCILCIRPVKLVF